MDNNKLTLAAWKASWCSGCLTMKPILDDFEEQHPDVDVIRIDVDDSPGCTERHHIVKIPTMIFFQGIKTVDRINGTCSLERLNEGYEKFDLEEGVT